MVGQVLNEVRDLRVPLCLSNSTVFQLQVDSQTIAFVLFIVFDIDTLTRVTFQLV